MTHCENRNKTLEANFCPHCGQKRIDLKRPLSQLLGEMLREAFDVDGRGTRTLRALFRHPGLLTSEYLAGRRVHYSPPFRLYLVASVLFFVVAGWVAARGVLLLDDQTVSLDASEQARFIGDDLPRLMFVLLPVFALLLKLAFRQRFYFEHLIHALHLHCAVYLILCLLLPLERAANLHWALLALQVTLFAYLLWYCITSIQRVYAASWRASVAKTLAILLGYLTLLPMAFETFSRLTLPESAVIPFLTD